MGVEERFPEVPIVKGEVEVPTVVNVFVVEISYADGGVIVILETRFVPETLNEVEEEAVPYVVERAERVPLVLIVGDEEVSVMVEPFIHLTVLLELLVPEGMR